MQSHSCTKFAVFVVECRGHKVCLPIFVDTAGQKACLNRKSWSKLAPGVDFSHWNERQFVRGNIHGVSAKLHVAQGQTEGVNMVGKDWLSEAKLIFIADYCLDGRLLLKSDQATRAVLRQLPIIDA